MAVRVLILAYGNPLRSDDGVAWHAAELLRQRLSSDDAEIVCVHQLTPELAEAVSHASGTIFIDAREDGEPGQICEARVAQDAEGMCGTHMFAPSQLMALCNTLYGNRPEAYEVSVTGESFTHGEDLSYKLKIALPQMVAIVDRLARRVQKKPAY
jgi:hydrogenase maturation protease